MAIASESRGLLYKESEQKSQCPEGGKGKQALSQNLNAKEGGTVVAIAGLMGLLASKSTR